ncbi:MAG: GNAT family protein [Dehalococcoidia bacterium]
MLEGKLVRLRAIEPEDRARAAAWLSDPEVTRYLTYRYPSSDGDWMAGPPGPNGYANGVWLSIDTHAGEHIGAVNLHRVHYEDRKAALGIVVGAKSYWGKGFGGDAVLTLARFAFDEMNLNRVWLTVVEDHAAAIACYKRGGFQEEARLRQEVYRDGRFLDFVQMGILRREFEALISKGGSDA